MLATILNLSLHSFYLFSLQLLLTPISFHEALHPVIPIKICSGLPVDMKNAAVKHSTKKLIATQGKRPVDGR